MGSKSPTLPSAFKEVFTNVLLSLMGASSTNSAQLTDTWSIIASHLWQSRPCTKIRFPGVILVQPGFLNQNSAPCEVLINVEKYLLRYNWETREIVGAGR